MTAVTPSPISSGGAAAGDVPTGTSSVVLQPPPLNTNDDDEKPFTTSSNMTTETPVTAEAAATPAAVSQEQKEQQPSLATSASDNDDDGHAVVASSHQYHQHQQQQQPLFEYYELPKCKLPPQSEYEPVEKFVANAIRGCGDQRQQQSSYRVIIDSLKGKGNNNNKSNNNNNNPVPIGTLRNMLLALRTADNGSILPILTSSSSSSSSNSNNALHARLLHALIKFDPFKIINAQQQQQNNAGDNKKKKKNKKKRDENNNNMYELADAYLHLLLAIVSSNTVFLVPAITSVWKLLIQYDDVDESCDIGGNNNENDNESENDTTDAIIAPSTIERTKRLHATLATMIRLCPKTKDEIGSIILSNAPYFRTHTQQQITWYYRQCLIVIEKYCPELQSQVIELIIDKCLEMDVEIKITDIGEATIDNEKDTSNNDKDEAIFELELDDNAAGTTTASPDEKKKEDTAAKEKAIVEEMANKLDSLMLLLFEYCTTSTSSATTGVGGSSTGDLYRVLSHVFESTVLICHKSKFVQFVLFYICGLQEDQEEGATTQELLPTTATDEAPLASTPSLLYRDFASTLIDIVLDPYRATVTRQTGACYLASFISRASYVCPETVCESVSALLRWAEAYVDSLQQSSSSPTTIVGVGAGSGNDARSQCSLHTLFYTVCQSAFYIMCFRGADAINYYRNALKESELDQQRQQSNVEGDDDASESSSLLLDPDHIDISSERWTKLLCSQHNKAQLYPLRYCLESVRIEFLELSKKYDLVDSEVLKSILDDNDNDGPTSVSMAAQQQRQQKNNNKKRRTAKGITTAATLEKERLRGGVGGLGQGTNPLDSFFPFDPYLLRRSHAYLEPYYIHWCGVAGGSSSFSDNNGDADDTTTMVVDNEEEEGLGDRDDDHNSIDDSDIDSNVSDDDDNGDENDIEEEEDDDDYDDTNVDFQPMSLASNASPSFMMARMDDNAAEEGTTTPDMAIIKKDRAWTDITRLKRNRAASIESAGSW